MDTAHGDLFYAAECIMALVDGEVIEDPNGREVGALILTEALLGLVENFGAKWVMRRA